MSLSNFQIKETPNEERLKVNIIFTNNELTNDNIKKDLCDDSVNTTSILKVKLEPEDCILFDNVKVELPSGETEYHSYSGDASGNENIKEEPNSSNNNCFISKNTCIQDNIYENVSIKQEYVENDCSSDIKQENINILMLAEYRTLLQCKVKLIRQVYYNGTYFICKYCHKLFQQEVHMQEHCLTHKSNEKKITNAYNVEQIWLDDVKVELPKGETEYDYNSNDEYIKETVNERPYSYSNCLVPKSTHNLTKCNLTNEKPYKCNQCEYSAKYRSRLAMHKHSHTDERPFNCNQCEYSAKDRTTLLRHKSSHTGERPFKCNQCEYGAKRRSLLVRHNRTHTGERPFKCNQCEYSAKDRTTLLKHKRIHTGERPFKCNQCEYSAKDRTTLLRHKSSHTAERPFKCNQCEYSTRRRSHLVRHNNIHTDERPFKCNQCEYSAIKKGTLNKHMKTHSGVKLLENYNQLP